MNIIILGTNCIFSLKLFSFLLAVGWTTNATILFYETFWFCLPISAGSMSFNLQIVIVIIPITKARIHRTMIPIFSVFGSKNTIVLKGFQSYHHPINCFICGALPDLVPFVQFKIVKIFHTSLGGGRQRKKFVKLSLFTYSMKIFLLEEYHESKVY